MIETVIPVGVAVATGFSVLDSRIHTRVNELDRRVDRFELRVAENYVSKIGFSSALDRVEAHMVGLKINLTDKTATTYNNDCFN